MELKRLKYKAKLAYLKSLTILQNGGSDNDVENVLKHFCGESLYHQVAGSTQTQQTLKRRVFVPTNYAFDETKFQKSPGQRFLDGTGYTLLQPKDKDVDDDYIVVENDTNYDKYFITNDTQVLCLFFILKSRNDSIHSGNSFWKDSNWILQEAGKDNVWKRLTKNNTIQECVIKLPSSIMSKYDEFIYFSYSVVTDRRNYVLDTRTPWYIHNFNTFKMKTSFQNNMINQNNFVVVYSQLIPVNCTYENTQQILNNPTEMIRQHYVIEILKEIIKKIAKRRKQLLDQIPIQAPFVQPQSKIDETMTFQEAQKLIQAVTDAMLEEFPAANTINNGLRWFREPLFRDAIFITQDKMNAFVEHLFKHENPMNDYSKPDKVTQIDMDSIITHLQKNARAIQNTLYDNLKIKENDLAKKKEILRNQKDEIGQLRKAKTT